MKAISRVIVLVAAFWTVSVWSQADEIAEGKHSSSENNNRGVVFDEDKSVDPSPDSTSREESRLLPDVGVILPEDISLWGKTSVFVEAIVLIGNTALSDTTVKTILSDYEGRQLNTRQLQVLREKLSRAYLEAGYVNSGVIIPDQAVSQGQLELHAIEGSLNQVRVVKDNRLQPSYVADRIAGKISAPLNINELQSAIQLLQQDPRIQRIAAELVPGSSRGEADLLVNVVEDRSWMTVLNIDNSRSESVGAERAVLAVSNNNVSGRGDLFEFGLGGSEGSASYSANYSLPLTANGLSLGFSYNLSDASVLEEPFGDLDVESETETAAISFKWPLIHDLRRDISVASSFEVKDSQTELLGEKFSLSPGSQDGRSQVSVLSLSFDWLTRSDSEVIAIRLTARKGLHEFGATDASDNPTGTVDADGDFLSYLGQVQYVRRLSERLRLNIRLMAQKANQPLLSLEKLAIGGLSTVRGHRENLLVRDNGFAANIEFPMQFSFDHPIVRRLIVKPFIDYGQSWDEVDTDTTSRIRNTNEKRYIMAAGIGFNLVLFDHITFDLAWADSIGDNFSDGEDPRHNIDDEGLQDKGVHFSLNYTRRF